MKNAPNYGEFYQRSLVLIGEDDSLSVQEKPESEFFTHWLIALEGTEIDKVTGAYQWNVFVFPSKKCGGFNYHQPFYVSKCFQSIHEAIDYTVQLEKKAKEDQLCKIAN
ncbi:hypothetical protein [Pseudalkalibacillus salsuginis]|uniref:hypothetical protein n=1 Tax=Pseudalkalibacillus salsuginis TaxID=2910972 RepID=UPI001F33EBDD|nr:hypothetical protein [Pseudalkalibacillus salsuginis]MCF6411698.1 hypothetical protein [Pseudalkalibacillus salsuginis]